MGAGLTRSTAWRAAWTILFVLLIGVRLVTPAGFMPGSTSSGAAIILCDDGAPAMPAGHGQHHGGKAGHGGQHGEAKHGCPYASMTPFGTDDPPGTAITIASAFDALAPSSLRLILVERFRRAERPPARAPPVFA